MKRTIMKPQKRSMKELRKDTRGAVLVEFLVALMPLSITFFSFVQIAQIATARVVVKHATTVGARGAAVMANTHNNTPDQPPGQGMDVVKKGVMAAMGPWAKTMSNVDVKVDDKSGCDDKVFEMVTVTVDAQYNCSVPFGSFLVCGTKGGKHRIKETYAFPHQGASYKEGGGGGCGGGK
jgi:Flp pilus assembly protein TadG